MQSTFEVCRISCKVTVVYLLVKVARCVGDVPRCVRVEPSRRFWLPRRADQRAEELRRKKCSCSLSGRGTLTIYVWDFTPYRIRLNRLRRRH